MAESMNTYRKNDPSIKDIMPMEAVFISGYSFILIVAGAENISNSINNFLKAFILLLLQYQLQYLLSQDQSKDQKITNIQTSSLYFNIMNILDPFIIIIIISIVITIEMHYDPKCQNNKHKCTQICTSVICRLSNPFVCSACDNHHKADTCQIIPYKKMVKQFHKIQGLYTNQMLKYEQRVQNTFSQLMSKLRAEFVKFRQQFEYININQKISEIYQKIKKNKENELTGQKIHWALRSKCRSGISYKVKDQLTMRMQKQSIFQIFIEAIQKLPPYYSFKNVQEIQQHSNLSKNHIKMIQDMYMDQRKITSGIMGDQFKYLEEMMGRQIYNIHLLYRATQNNFEAQAFHKKCDGIANTITIAKTQFNNIVIGYCPFPWQSAPNWVYKEDRNQQCFLISPSKDLKGKKFTPFKTKFAIGMHKDYGPSFGDDFVIYDKAHNSKNCWSNFPDVYTCRSRPVQHNAQTITSFVGVKDHYQKFNLKEWQVYKLSFGKQDQQQNSYVKIYKTIPQN